MYYIITGTFCKWSHASVYTHTIKCDGRQDSNYRNPVYHDFGSACFNPIYCHYFQVLTHLTWSMCWNFAFCGLCVVIYSVFGKSLGTYKRCWKWCPQASIQAWTCLFLFANTFCRSACEMFLMYTVIAVFNSFSVRGRSRYTADFAAMRYRCFWEFFSKLFPCTKSVYLLPSRKMYSTRKTRSSIERTIVSKNWFNQLNTLLVLHFNCCFTAEYSEMSNNSSTLQYNFDTDNQIYVL